MHDKHAICTFYTCNHYSACVRAVGHASFHVSNVSFGSVAGAGAVSHVWYEVFFNEWGL